VSIKYERDKEVKMTVMRGNMK